MNACTWKQMRPRRVLKAKSSEKTSDSDSKSSVKPSSTYSFIYQSRFVLASSFPEQLRSLAFFPEIQRSKQTKIVKYFSSFSKSTWNQFLRYSRVLYATARATQPESEPL
ncbi:Hypothetical_protein [Hexamita inflata]|uniref:Hypothetical_protein n=1 Tax=Hexamita inflata TaxID=28002 RepID=A0AA86V9J0_9EUKA|nr:Hypothetical protein HINF_LOCUS47838 [Hexamita inflata]